MKLVNDGMVPYAFLHKARVIFWSRKGKNFLVKGNECSDFIAGKQQKDRVFAI